MLNAKRWTQILMVALVGVLVLGARVPAAAQDDEPIRLGVQPWLGYGPWWIAADQGFFENRGLNVEVIDFTWDQDMNAALASGQLDVQAAATNTLIALINAGVDVQGFLVMDASFEADAIIAPADVSSIEDLVGMQVAYELGSTSDLLINYALNEAGLSVEDIETIPMAAADAGAALVAERVGVAVTYEPYISAAIGDNPDYNVLYSAAERPGLISDVMVANREYIENNPETIEALVLAWDDAITFLRNNPDQGGAIIAEAVGSPLDEFQVAFEGVQVYSLEENAELLSGEFQETFVTVTDIMMMLNPDEITMAPDPADALVIEFVGAELMMDMEEEMGDDMAEEEPAETPES